MSKECRKVRAETSYEGRQGFSYLAGIARETVGAEALCMHLLRVPPGGRARAHRHRTHETAIYVISGSAEMYWGDRLEHRMVMGAGDLIYIPADVPHLPFNPGTEEAVAIIARTDPHEQESVELLPELEALVPG
ncbi:cupin domain-containing protein [Jannaschia formosa]|uniref:cupin domain-containing protein n=1 Tax=Jannaschia formosa TaxID=2259592 RepID=UPI000E1BB4EB|nr:cupin domain-containing protein [Jannaschia formosa]TFL16919.1 cupin domain-containing protein [Jannaschia formosa]